MTEIYCDIADIRQIKKFSKKKIVKGFTTNPSLMRKAGAKSYKDYSKNILKICKQKPVSLEVFADDYLKMKNQALKIKIISKDIYSDNKSVGLFEIAKIKRYSSENEAIDIMQKALKLRQNFPPYIYFYICCKIFFWF